MSNKLNDLTGKKFGRLTVIERSGSDKHGTPLWLCKCDCSNKKLVRGYDLVRGSTKSCGCLSSEMFVERHKKHGMKNTRLYEVWKSMRKRCFNPNSPNYKNYGGRGITICDEWKDSFKAFYDWAISSGYDSNAKRGEYTIDRIDVNGNYEPSNCRWLTIQEQQRNKRNNKEKES